MPGTDPAARTAAWVRHLTIGGWLLLGGSFGFIGFQLDRVRSIGPGDSPFDVWDQRIEVLSFIMLPPNLTVLVPPAAAAVTATALCRGERDVWLDALLRIVAGIAVVMAVIGAVSILNIAVNDDGNVDGVFLRLGGVSIAAGIAWLCRAADTLARE